MSLIPFACKLTVAVTVAAKSVLAPKKFRKRGVDICGRGREAIERSFNDHKQWRGLATRYDKLAAVYRGGVVLRAITIWLHAGDKP